MTLTPLTDNASTRVSWASTFLAGLVNSRNDFSDPWIFFEYIQVKLEDTPFVLILSDKKIPSSVHEGGILNRGNLIAEFSLRCGAPASPVDAFIIQVVSQQINVLLENISIKQEYSIKETRDESISALKIKLETIIDLDEILKVSVVELKKAFQVERLQIILHRKIQG